MLTAPAVREREFTELVATHRQRLEAAAYRLTRDRALAEDAVSAAVTKVWRRWGEVDIAHPAAYLSRAVRNEAIDEIRQRERERTALRRAFERIDDRSIERHVENRALVSDLIRAIPEPHRQAVVLRYLEGLTVAETSTVLAAPTGTVKSSTSRGLESLRRLHAADNRAGAVTAHVL